MNRSRVHLMTSALLTAILGTATAQELNSTKSFVAVANWGQLPDGRKWGSTDAADVDGDGNVWVAERCGGPTCQGSSLPVIFRFDQSGRIAQSFGSGMFISPHGIHIDRDRNIWITDRIRQQVLKFRPDGTLVMELGTRGVAGNSPSTFDEPCDVIVGPTGDIFVADGHSGQSNARIVKFANDGRFIKAWGTKGTGAGQFDVPHSLAMDSQGRLFVADRGNSRIQVFDQDGTFLHAWPQFRRLSGIFIDRHDVLYATDSGVTKRPGTGIRIANASTGEITMFIADPEVGTGGAEGVAADGMGNIYRPEASGRGLVKYVKQ